MNIFCPLRTILGTENPDRNVKAKRFEMIQHILVNHLVVVGY